MLSGGARVSRVIFKPSMSPTQRRRMWRSRTPSTKGTPTLPYEHKKVMPMVDLIIVQGKRSMTESVSLSDDPVLSVSFPESTLQIPLGSKIFL